MPTRAETPPVAHEVIAIVRDVLGEALIGAYLHGSAVLGGLRPTSDIDVLAVIDRPTIEPNSARWSIACSRSRAARPAPDQDGRSS